MASAEMALVCFFLNNFDRSTCIPRVLELGHIQPSIHHLLGFRACYLHHLLRVSGLLPETTFLGFRWFTDSGFPA